MINALDLKHEKAQEALQQSIDEIIDEPALLEFALVKGPLQEGEDYWRMWELLSELVEHGKGNRVAVDFQEAHQIVDAVFALSDRVHSLLREYVKGGNAE